LRKAQYASIALAFFTPLLGGCGSANDVPAHTADEQKAVSELNSMTPQEQIDRLEKGPMPAAAKAAMIAKIKKDNGLK
jgi:hypothetical protein